MHFAGLSYELSQPLYSNYSAVVIKTTSSSAQLSTYPTCRMAHCIANQILTRMSMAYWTARITAIRECFLFCEAWKCRFICGSVTNHSSDGTINTTTYRWEGVKSNCLRWSHRYTNPIIDSNVGYRGQPHDNRRTVLVKVCREIARIAAPMPWPLYPREKDPPVPTK